MISTSSEILIQIESGVFAKNLLDLQENTDEGL